MLRDVDPSALLRSLQNGPKTALELAREHGLDRASVNRLLYRVLLKSGAVKVEQPDPNGKPFWSLP